MDSWWFTIFAASGVIFAAVYLLWMYERVVFGVVKNDKLNTELTDLNTREFIVLIPLLIFIVWIGIYPNTFLGLTENSVNHILQAVSSYSTNFFN